MRDDENLQRASLPCREFYLLKKYLKERRLRITFSLHFIRNRTSPLVKDFNFLFVDHLMKALSSVECSVCQLAVVHRKYSKKKKKSCGSFKAQVSQILLHFQAE